MAAQVMFGSGVSVSSLLSLHFSLCKRGLGEMGLCELLNKALLFNQLTYCKSKS